MDRIEEVEQKFRQYFKTYEIVSKSVFESLDTDEIYDLLTNEIKAVMVHIRESVGLPMIINNWKNGGPFQFRGYREVQCSIGAKKSQHREGNAFDFHFVGKNGEQGRELIILKAMVNLPYPIRIEEGVNWCHVDCKKVDNSHKINYFRP